MAEATTQWKDPFEGLNSQQKEVVAWNLGVLRVCAVAGSGKTRSMVNRIARLVRDGADPNRILAVTFTKKAAMEMEERLKELGCPIAKKGGKGARVGTFHSLCLEIIRDGSPWADYLVDEDNEMRRILKQRITGYCMENGVQIGMNWKDVDLTEVEQWIGKNQNELIPPHESKHPYDRRFDEAYARWEEERDVRGILTFDSMLFLSNQYLDEDEQARSRWANKYQHVMIDEYQDTNLAQKRLVDILAKKADSFMIVGDDDQCQPPDTMVQIKPSKLEVGETPIVSLDEGSKVRVFNRHSGKVTGTRSVTKKQVRWYKGPMIHVEVGNCKTRTTPSHKFLTRWTDRTDTEKWVVYLMRREDRGYRVGWCQLFNSEGALHFGQRARLEKADAAWILEVHDTKKRASAAESIIAANFGIPTVMLEPNGELYDEEVVSKIFNEIDSWENGSDCLRAYRLDPELPLWPHPLDKAQDENGRYRHTMFKIFAINLIPELFSLPLEQGGWTPIGTVEQHEYQGDVVSLDVADEHNYVADGIVTCNSIYEWRGAKPRFMIEFETEYPAVKSITLGTNYRSVPEVITASNRVIKYNEIRIEKQAQAHREAEGKAVVVEPTMDMDEEAENTLGHIRELVSDGLNYRDFTILYRTNAQSRAFEEVFLREQIPYVVVGGQDFYKRKEVADVLAYLRLMANQDTAEPKKMTHRKKRGPTIPAKKWPHCQRAVNNPFRYIGKKSIEKLIEAAEKNDCSMFQACEEFADQVGLRSNQVRGLRAFTAAVNKARSMDMRTGIQLSDVISTLLDDIGYIDWIQRDQGSDTSENSRVSNIRELIRTANRFPNAPAFLEYVDKMEHEKKKKVDGERVGNLVQLMTVHKAKGLEFPVVFLAGSCEDILPHARSENLEEERRLFYVACTRAKDRLFIMVPRAAWIGSKLRELRPSRFIAEAGIDGARPSDTKDVI